MLDIQNTETRFIAMQIHTWYNSHIQEQENECIERQFYKDIWNTNDKTTHF